MVRARLVSRIGLTLCAVAAMMLSGGASVAGF
jgi:hypothetical protein